MLGQDVILQNRYRIVVSLGHGGMGAIYKAFDTRLDVYVAIKEMIPQPGIDESSLKELRAQFRQEAATLARLDHPNLVRVTDFFEEGGNAYLVMDFLEGETLADRIIREGALAEGQVVDWAVQLLDALSYCHTHGVLHRDIKPQNILLRSDGRAVLIDFGLVKLWNVQDPQTRTAMRGMGTPEYAPPEQYAGTDQHTDPRSDLYALGATLYHALTGERPLSATDRMALPEKFLMPRVVAPGINPQTEMAVLKAMSLKLSDRWESADQMTGILKKADGTEWPSAGPVYPAHPPTEVLPGASMAQPGFSGPPQGVGPMQPSQPLPAKKRPTWLLGLGGLAIFGGFALLCVIFFILRGIGKDDPTVPPTATRAIAIVTDTIAATPTRRSLNPTPSDQAGGSPFQITVSNDTSENICYVLISSSEETQWGEDWLGENQVITPGNSESFTTPGGPHDLMVMDCEEVVLGTAWEITSDEVVTIGGTGLVTLQVVNESSVDLCYAFFSPVESDTWGEDWLGAKESILAGEGIRLFYLTPGSYDFLVRDCDGNDLATKENVDLTADITWTIQD